MIFSDGKSICWMIWWDDLVNNLSIHTYIAGSQHEAMFEEKWRKKNEGVERSYKLQLDIEVGTNMKVLLKWQILNGKVECTKGEFLGITKREFHKVIIDIIENKHQAPSDMMLSNTL